MLARSQSSENLWKIPKTFAEAYKISQGSDEGAYQFTLFSGCNKRKELSKKSTLLQTKSIDGVETVTCQANIRQLHTCRYRSSDTFAFPRGPTDSVVPGLPDPPMVSTCTKCKSGHFHFLHPLLTPSVHDKLPSVNLLSIIHIRFKI